MTKALVAYFSASGMTRKLAERHAEAIKADIAEIAAQPPYTKADLDWRDQQSRSTLEMADHSSRPAFSCEIETMDEYDVIFVGFPIWWYREPSIIDTFMEAYDFTGKTVVPFATSGGSDIGESGENMQKLAPGAKVEAGKRVSSITSDKQLQSWAEKYL